MDQELHDLVPIFVEEARDRLERLASRAPQIDDDPEAVAEVKRELHTLKGAGRMLQLPAVAELCHATEELLEGGTEGQAPLLTRVVDRLSEMVDRVAAGETPEPDAELLEILGGQAPVPAEPAAPPPPPEPEPPTEPPLDPPAPEPAAAPAADSESPGPSADAEPQRPAAAAPIGANDIRVDATALDAVADRATQVRIMALAGSQLADRLYDLGHLAEEGLREPQPTQVLAVLASMLRRLAVEFEGGQRRMIRAAEAQLEDILTVQLQPLRGPLLSLGRHARELGRSLGREIEVSLEGEETRLDRRITRELDDALLHLVRNAVDHGIEPPEERQAAGKPPSGQLTITAQATGSRVRLVIQDDGAGIHPQRVLQQAVQVGLVDRAAASSLSEKEIFRLLFAPGFSTRRQVSEISGRGLGLDVVASTVARVGGEVFLEAESGRGTRVIVEVPVARRGEEVLLVRVGQLRLALPSAVARRAWPIAADEVVERGGRTLGRIDDRLVPFVPLARIFGEAPAETQMLLEGEVSGQQLAITVDEVEGEEEVLVRPLTRLVPTDRLLEGVALLASGEPVGVLSPAALAQRDYMRARQLPQEAVASRRVQVLLVDDSLVTREMERRLLEDAGFEVVTSSDADEALSRLGERNFDCVVTDIEMPGMDGFELTEHLRSIEHFAQLPIIVVSTRDRPEDRLRGLKAGADAYLTKQSLDAGELVDLVRRLGGR